MNPPNHAGRVSSLFRICDVGALKSDHSRRVIPLSSTMARRLWELGADQPDTARVFTSPEGFPISYGNLRSRVLVPAAEAAGLEWVTFHTFRHTCASLLFEAGRDVKQVAEWLGHADPAFTLRTYVHLMDQGVGDAEFMAQVVQVGDPQGGKGVAREHQETAANASPAETVETAG